MPGPLQGLIYSENSQGWDWNCKKKCRWGSRELLEGRAGRESLEGLLGAMWGKMSERGHLSPFRVWKVISSCRRIYRPHSASGDHPESPSHHSISCGFEPISPQHQLRFSPVSKALTVFCAYAVRTPLPPLGVNYCRKGKNLGLLLPQTPTEFMMQPLPHFLKSPLPLPIEELRPCSKE